MALVGAIEENFDSYGHTIDEAVQNIAEAVVLCLQEERPPQTARFVGVRDLEVSP